MTDARTFEVDQYWRQLRWGSEMMLCTESWNYVMFIVVGVSENM
jgi:hypothetical protein